MPPPEDVKVILPPTQMVPAEVRPAVAVIGTQFTTCDTELDVLALFEPSPLYSAVIECVPTVSDVVE